LQLKDKLDVINEMFRILKPGGVFIFNFPPPLAYGYHKDVIINNCSFYSLNTMIREVIVKSGFIIEDIKPSYYPPNMTLRKIIGYAIIIPFAVSILRLNDLLLQKNMPIENSSTIYIKLRKPV
jgi:ubiquinone/menaquinone biosynthesis C-methylase UbiE